MAQNKAGKLVISATPNTPRAEGGKERRRNGIGRRKEEENEEGMGENEGM